jgi:hypothetical protein
MVNVNDVAVMLAGLGVVVTPLGSPAVVSAMGAANSLIRVAVIVADPVPPCGTLNVDGAAASAKDCAVELKVAVTLALTRGVNVHVTSVPTHEPDQLTNALPVVGAAVSVTSPTKPALHAPPQLMPAGFEVTVPLPDPAFDTVTNGRDVIVRESCATADVVSPLVGVAAT